jgi:hypothetical protein
VAWTSAAPICLRLRPSRAEGAAEGRLAALLGFLLGWFLLGDLLLGFLLCHSLSPPSMELEPHETIEENRPGFYTRFHPTCKDYRSFSRLFFHIP